MGKFKIPFSVAILISLTLLSLLLALILLILFNQISSFYKQLPVLQPKLNELIQWGSLLISDTFDITAEQQKIWFKDFISGRITTFFALLWSSSGSLGLFILIPVYAGLILYYRRSLVAFLNYIIPSSLGFNIISILSEVITAYYNFIKGMILIYIIVGILNGTGLYILSIPNPFFFGFVASILTIIPYIGIAIGALLPVAVAWVTHESIWYPVGVIIVFSFVQILEANIIFPFAVGHRLKVNALSILIVVIAGGLIWGVSGMILFIPFIGILKLIADKVSLLKPVSLLLDEKQE